MNLRTNMVNFKRFIGASVVVVSLFVLFQILEACGRPNSGGSASRVAIPISVTKNSGTALSEGLELVSTGTTVTVSVGGCTSGLTEATTAIPGGTVALFLHDTNCAVKLQTFVFGTTTYSATATGATNFTTWTAGSVATFANTVLSTDRIKVFVNTQVTQAGVVSTDTVSYNFTDIASTTTQNLSAVQVQTGVPLAVTSSNLTPYFTMTAARVVSFNSNASANMSFTLQCQSTVTGNTAANYACNGANLQTQFDYILVKDNYSQGAITVQQAIAAFAANTPTSVSTLVVGPNGSDLNSNVLQYGGFYTSNASPLATGTTAVYPSSLSYVFMLRQKTTGGNATGFLYFYIEFAPSVPSDVSGCGTFFAGGSGIASDPYIVVNAITLSNTQFCNTSSTYFIQQTNIDLGGAATPWTPIPLYGQYNGNGKTISNLYINGGLSSNIGLFGTINTGASVSNLTLTAADVTGGQTVGVLAANMTSGTISNVSIGGTLNVISISAGGVVNAGGLVGNMTGGTISSSVSSVTLSLTSSTNNGATVNLGGIIGNASASVAAISLSNVQATGSITSSAGQDTSGTSFASGGIVGSSAAGAFSVTITNCLSKANQTHGFYFSGAQTLYIGGVAGIFTGGTVSSCLVSAAMTLTGQPGNMNVFFGMLLGHGGNNTTSVQNSVAMGSASVSGSAGSVSGTLGGLIGCGGANPGMSMTNSYAANTSLSGSTLSIGQVLGACYINVSNVYVYNNGSVGNSGGGIFTTGSVTAYTTTTQMQTQSNFAFDFSTPVWRMPNADPLSTISLLSPVPAWVCGTNSVTCAFNTVTIANGSFETGTFNAGSGVANLNAGNGTLTSWTIGGGGIKVFNTIDLTSAASIYSVDLNGSAGTSGSVSQNITTVNGTTYTFYFDLAGNPSCGASTMTLTVAAGATSQSYSFNTSGFSSTIMGWTTKTFTFKATAASTALSFTSTVSGTCGPMIDNIH